MYSVLHVQGWHHRPSWLETRRWTPRPCGIDLLDLVLAVAPTSIVFNRENTKHACNGAPKDNDVATRCRRVSARTKKSMNWMSEPLQPLCVWSASLRLMIQAQLYDTCVTACPLARRTRCTRHRRRRSRSMRRPQHLTSLDMDASSTRSGPSGGSTLCLHGLTMGEIRRRTMAARRRRIRSCLPVHGVDLPGSGPRHRLRLPLPRRPSPTLIALCCHRLAAPLPEAPPACRLPPPRHAASSAPELQQLCAGPARGARRAGRRGPQRVVPVPCRHGPTPTSIGGCVRARS